MALCAMLIGGISTACAQEPCNSACQAREGFETIGEGTKEAAEGSYNTVKEGTVNTYEKAASGVEKGYEKTKEGVTTGYEKTKEGDNAEPLIERINKMHGTHTVDYAEEIGLGTTHYTLVDIDAESRN